MKKVKVGLLPLYVKLYDDCLAFMRPSVEKYYDTIVQKLEEEGLEILRSPICRLEDEFKAALDGFEAGGAEAVITLHLAYSPSLQSEKPLRECKLPLIVLDTTPDYAFKPTGSTAAIDFNHGIHGVQDMCNLLRRNHVPFDIFAGHWAHSDVCRRAADCAKAHAAANALAKARVGIIGEPFAGMGDFQIPYEDMKRQIGIEVVPLPAAQAAVYADAVTEDRIDAMKAQDDARFINEDVPEDRYREVSRVSLGVRDWCEAEKLDAFTVNFLAVSKTSGLRHMVFERACRAMEEGIGYAGEGDVLTAALVGALLKGWENTTFVEMFCPDWEDNVVFLGHMGEYNLRIADGKPRMILRPFPFSDSGDPYAIMAPMMPGKAVILNLAPLGNGKFSLIAVSGEMQKAPENSSFTHVVNGWFKPDQPLSQVLQTYSLHGGTHHSAMVYGADAQVFSAIAKHFGWEFVSI